MKNGIEYSIRPHQMNECRIGYTVNPLRIQLWENFTQGQSPYGTTEEPANWQEQEYAAAPEYINLLESEIPEQHDWKEDIIEDNITDAPLPDRHLPAQNPFSSIGRRRLDVTDIRRLEAAADHPEVDENVQIGGVVYHPPHHYISNYIQNARREERSVILSDDLPSEMRSPHVLQQIAQSGVLIFTHHVHEIHPATTIILHPTQRTFLRGYRNLRSQKFKLCQKFARQYDAIMRTCRHS